MMKWNQYNKVFAAFMDQCEKQDCCYRNPPASQSQPKYKVSYTCMSCCWTEMSNTKQM